MPNHDFPRNRRVILFIVLLTPPMILASICGVLWGWWLIQIVGLIGVIFFGGGMIMTFIIILQNPTTALSFTNDGFYDATSSLAPGQKFLIPWEKITSLEPMNGGDEVGIKFTDPDLVRRHLNPVQRVVSKANRKVYSAHHILSLAHIKGPYAAGNVIAQMESYISNRQQQLGTPGVYEASAIHSSDELPKNDTTE